MSERFQRTYIPVREFVESWDKELYELNNLDYFVYKLINHLGNQMENRFFIQEKKHSPLFLDFERIGTLCFNLGDSFEFFLQENCLGSCSLNCPRDLKSRLDLSQARIEENIKQKLLLLQSLMPGRVEKEQCLRVDIMNYVILDTLFQFYDDTYNLELTEDDPQLLELAEFIEDEMVNFVRIEGETLLQRPFQTALNFFEELLQTDTDDQAEEDNWYDSGEGWNEDQPSNDWQVKSENLEVIFKDFLSNNRYSPAEDSAELYNDINYFKRFLSETASASTIWELSELHLAKFFSIWLVQEFVMADEKQIQHIFRATARFITYLFNYYGLNLKREFLKYYEKTKRDVPRVVHALNQYIADYDLLAAILSGDTATQRQKLGYFEIEEITDKVEKRVRVTDLHGESGQIEFCFNSGAFSSLRKGDVINASLLFRNERWELFDVQFIYPPAAKKLIVESSAGSID